MFSFGLMRKKAHKKKVAGIDTRHEIEINALHRFKARYRKCPYCGKPVQLSKVS